MLMSAQDIEANAKRVHGLVHKKTISADTAVQVALLNNRGLQASYAELGVSSADVWQSIMQPNPVVSFGVLGINADGLGAYRAIEGMIAFNLLSVFTQPDRTKLAELRFTQAQLRAVEDTLRVAVDTRRAWIEAVSGFEQAGLIRDAQSTADAGSELAARLGDTGFLNKAEQAREHAFFAELSGQRAKARLEAQMAKEALTRQLGLWGTEVDYFVPNNLPRLPGRARARSGIEAEALSGRVDLAIAKLELQANAQARGMENATRFVTDLELIAGFEKERELEDGVRETETTPQIELEFAIPIFDSGKARLKRAEAQYLIAAHQLAERAVNVRSEARSAYAAYSGTYKIARHYRDAVLPLRRTIEEEALLSYNGMITNTFELLADTRGRLNANLMEAEARREFWLADANMMAAIYGGGAASGAAGGGAEVAAGGDAGH
ncbi:TolC family protein [Roseovarius sp. CAU 1744]|uniref:TolC family protein n=1 Tax=Roseovarius sp. CAU 1744 TaxID=3140368 RepID=UPI00325C11E6